MVSNKYDWCNELYHVVDINDVLVLKYKYYGYNIEMEKEKTPVERLHDDIRRAIEKIEDDVDDIVRIHCHENDDAG